jgi:hypothetical protein
MLLMDNKYTISIKLENWEYGCVDPLRWPRDTIYLQKLVLTSRKSGGRSVGTVRLQTKATGFF